MPRIQRKPAQRTVARPSSRLPMATAPTGPAPPPKRRPSKDRKAARTEPTDVEAVDEEQRWWSLDEDRFVLQHGELAGVGLDDGDAKAWDAAAKQYRAAQKAAGRRGGGSAGGGAAFTKRFVTGALLRARAAARVAVGPDSRPLSTSSAAAA